MLTIIIIIIIIIIISIIIIITKLLLRQYPRKESSSVAHPVQGLGKLTVKVQCKVHQQMIRWSENLGKISKSEKVSFQKVTERNYSIPPRCGQIL